MVRTAPKVVAVACCLAASGCSGGGVVDAGDVSVLVSGDLDGGMDAAFGGRLEVVGDCAGSGDSVIIWPPGTEVVDEDPLTLSVPRHGGDIALGDSISLGGGFVFETSTPDDEQPTQVSGDPIPKGCQGYDIFLASGD